MPNSAFSARPSSLSTPVPGQAEQDDLDQFLSTAEMPQMRAPAGAPAQPAGDDLDAFLAGSGTAAPQPGGPVSPYALQPGSPEAQLVAGAMPENFPREPEPGFVEANVNQFETFKDRLQAGLGADDTEKANFLRQKYGDKNVKINGEGDIYFRKEGQTKFKRFDPDTFELVNDIVADFSREGVYEAVQVPGEVAGGYFGGPMGVQLARTLGAIPANWASDKVAEMSGIPENPERNKYAETATAMALEAALPFAGRHLAKRLPGTLAYKAAKEAGERETVALTAHSKKVAQAAQELESEGIMAEVRGELVGIPGANVKLMGHQLHPDSPDLIKRVGLAQEVPAFQNAQNQLALDWGTQLDTTLQEIGRRGGVGPVPPERLAQVVTNAVDTLEKSEGKAIGEFKKTALKELKNEKIPLPNDLAQHTANIMTELGFTRKFEKKTFYKREPYGPTAPTQSKRGEFANPLPEGTAPGAYTDAAKQVEVITKTPGVKGGMRYTPQERITIKWVPPKDLGKVSGRMGITDPGQLKAFSNTLEEFANKSGDGLRIGDIEMFVNRIGALQPTAGRTGGPISGAWGKLSSDLRKFRRDTIKAGLPDAEQQQAFDNIMDDFGNMRDSVDTLRNVLKSEQGAKAIVSSLFTGKDSVSRVRAMKSLTKDSPEVWAALKEEFINQNLLTKYRNSSGSPTGFNSKAMLDSMDKQYGPEFMKLVLDDGPGPNRQTVRNILTVTERLESTYKGAKVDAMDEKAKQGAMNVLVGLFGGIKFKTINGVQGLFMSEAKNTGKLLHDIMTRDGIDRFVQQYPGRIDKKAVTQNLRDFMAQYRVMQQLGKAPAFVERNLMVEKGQTGLGGNARNRMGLRQGIMNQAERPQQAIEQTALPEEPTE